VYLNADTDEKLLKTYGLRKAGGYYGGELTEKEADGLRSKLKASDAYRISTESSKLILGKGHSVSCDCICYQPTLSTQGNIELVRFITREELAAGWGPGYTEPDSCEQKGEESNLSWTQWLMSLVGIELAKKEPEPDPTLDPNWQPEFC
jgi:hypothetical protein